ncbi:MAG: hypothetical protein KR126chlam1_00821 [Chlamydiae bacterium]|nr:hypothetical protein [Chlamydiota bacterium]
MTKVTESLSAFKTIAKQSEKLRFEKKRYPRTPKRAKFSKKVQANSLALFKKELKKEKLASTNAGSTQDGPLQNPLTLKAEAELAVRSNRIAPSVQVSQLFDKMVSSLFTIHKEGVSETTFNLDGTEFASSIFSGAQITITEYSTAPKIFNIQFCATPEALAFFEGHAGELMNALQKGKFDFGVHRLDTTLMAEKDQRLLPKVERDLEKEEKGR